MKSIPSGWTERHVEAYEAWRAGDPERLCEACKPEIDRYARRLPWAVEELRSAGRKGVEKARQRWNPERGVPFQGYARQDIYWEIRRQAEAIYEVAQRRRTDEVEDGGEGSPGGASVALRIVRDDEWRDAIAGLDIEHLRMLCALLDEHRDVLVAAVGKHKFSPIRGLAGVYLTVRTMGENGFIDISGPINAQIIRGLHRSYNSPSESVSFSELGRLLGVSDKTAKRYYECWEKDPPRENEDLFDYLYRVVNPRGHR